MQAVRDRYQIEGSTVFVDIVWHPTMWEWLFCKFFLFPPSCPEKQKMLIKCMLSRKYTPNMKFENNPCACSEKQNKCVISPSQWRQHVAIISFKQRCSKTGNTGIVCTSSDNTEGIDVCVVCVLHLDRIDNANDASNTENDIESVITA